MSDQASKSKGLVWALAALLLGGLLACGVAPLAHAVPMGWERHLGQALGQDPGAAACRPSPQARELLKRLVARIYPLDAEDRAQPIEVRVARDPVLNAYAGLGGTITINSALLERAGSPEELAGVLAHEMGHVRHRHVMEGLLVHLFTWEGLRLIFGGGSGSAGLVQFILKMDFTKAQERQADEAGLKRLQQAQVDTQGLKRFFERMQKDEPGSRWLSDHPDDEDRIKMAESYATEHPRPVMTKEEWKILRNDGCGS